MGRGKSGWAGGEGMAAHNNLSRLSSVSPTQSRFPATSDMLSDIDSGSVRKPIALHRGSVIFNRAVEVAEI